MNKKSTLVLGVGNLLLKDEGVGIHVVRQLQDMSIAPDVEVIDGGTGSFELIEHFRGKKKVIIVDAVRADAKSGTILRFTPEEAALKWHASYTAHQLTLYELLHFAREINPKLQIVVIGIVPEETGCFSTQLSRMVKRQMHRMITEIIKEIQII